ncbi:disease resistance protein RPV1-like [Vitis riparia]|uniref:disease resistance protein RPV1-like n=1 Tax=Vitis riparia TaxID=96939 RepID=UPI00155A5289|nr:disease resistance protein RPV1-like [Vitis riparia]
MASSTQKPSSSSSTSIRQYNFDVFLSFRGEDTRNNFTDHLFENLVRMGINTFRDDQLKRGEEIKSELLKTIEESRISIVVFSKDYAQSKWCLDELAKIMECRDKMEQIVFSVFYHVDPSDVRKQTGSFGEAFSIHERKVDEKKVQRWKDSLTEASDLSGFHVNDGYESKHIKEITNEICKRLNPKLLHIDDVIVGMDFRLKELKSLLSSDLHDIRVVGIYGTGGIGKTTIAKIVYNEIQCQFTSASFLQDVRETFNKHCQLQLQQQLLHDTMGDVEEFSNINKGINIIKARLSSKKVLIVIDDVDQLQQLESVARSPKWFGPGSTIIITTRNQHLLVEYGVTISYEATELHNREALQLFSQHAFKQNVPKADYVNLSNCLVRYAQGLPLALKVLGSSLRGMTIDEWKSALDKFKKNPMKEINDVLRISFDGLDSSQKEVFLDIACFFKGECEDVVLRILDGCKLDPMYNIRVLRDRCLITILDNVIQMHDLIQQMGWAIVREECPGDPNKWSRLWDVDDIYDAFSRQEGMKNIQTISLDLSRSKEIQFSTKVFAKMKKLRLLKIYCNDHDGLTREEYKVHLPKDFDFSHNLKYLHWQRCTLRSLPSRFYGEQLIEINLKSSNIKKLWKGNKCLGKLKGIDLSNSKQLVKMPKFSSMLNLERLNLEGCSSLRELHSSIGDLKWLTYLNLGGCEQLQSLPTSMKFEFLEVLYLNQCPKLKKIPEIHGNMGHLKELYLNESGIKELPSSIVYLSSLEVLNLSNCSNFEKFPEIHGNIKFLRELHLEGCSKFEKFPDTFTYMENLRRLHLCESGIKELPDSIGYLESLEILDLSYCLKFEKFPKIRGNMKCLKELSLDKTAIKELPNSIGSLNSLKILSLRKCSKFEKFSDVFINMGLLRELNLYQSGIKELPGSIGCLESLENLDLSHCSNFEKFPEIQGNMKSLKELSLKNTPIKELPNSIGCLQALEIFNLSGCSNLERFPEIQKNMGNLWALSLDKTAIKGLPCSIGHLTGLDHLNLENCRNLRSLPDNICGLTSLKGLFINGCSNLEVFSEITEDMEELKRLLLRETGITGLPSSIEHLRGLDSLELINCENLVALPNSIGSLTRLTSLRVRNCTKLHNLPDNLRSLRCCLIELDLGGCNLKEGEIPSDLWCLSSLVSLDVSENHIRCIPAGITQLFELKTLYMNHCPMLEEIVELPSSLTKMEAHGCPCLETETFSSPLWSSLLKCFKSPNQSTFFWRGRFVIPGSSGIPEWVSHQRMGCQVRIELPMNWYEDNNFLGFVLFFHHVPLDDDDECETTEGSLPHCELTISHGDQSERLVKIWFYSDCKTYWIRGLSCGDELDPYYSGSTSDPAIWVTYFPQINIPREYRSSWWNNFKAHFHTQIGYGSFSCGDNTCFKVKSCGIHLLYAQDQIHCPQPSRGSLGDREDHPAKTLKILQKIKALFKP